MAQKPQSLQDQACTDSLRQIAAESNGNNIEEDIYKGKAYQNSEGFGDVQQALKDLYKNKCAYCERKTHVPDIEHYRPKKQVSVPGNGSAWRKLANHNGYYWLAYEWSNLIPSCEACNRLRGKMSKFPLIDEARRIKASALANGLPADTDAFLLNQTERPYLLHPETDEPKNYFAFNAEGEMYGIDSENRGSMTIRICNLSHPDLNFHRKQVVAGFAQAIEDVCNISVSQTNIGDDFFRSAIERILRKLYEHFHNPEKEYRLLAWYIYENFKSIFSPPLLHLALADKIHVVYDSFYADASPTV